MKVQRNSFTYRLIWAILLCTCIVRCQEEASGDDSIQPFPAEEAKARVVQTSMDRQKANNALKLTENALLKYSDIEAALDHVSEAFSKREKGNWYCIRVGKSIVKTKLSREADSYVFMKIPPIDVYLFKLVETSDGSMSEAELIEASREENTGEEIYQNNLSDKEKDEAFFAVNWGLKNQNKFGDIEETVKDTMESKFGGEWRCFVMCRESKTSSTSGAGIFDIRKQTIASIEPLLYYGVGKIKVLLYKPVVKNGKEPLVEKPVIEKPLISYNQYDVIKEARLNLHKVEINQTEMDENMQQMAIKVVLNAIKTYNTYEGMTKYCRDWFDSNFNKPWECLIGLDGQFWTYFWFKRPFFINFKVDRLRVLIIKQYAY